jgi:hypothetical protein
MGELLELTAGSRAKRAGASSRKPRKAATAPA